MDNKLKTVDAETLLSTPMSKTMFIVDGLISQGINVISGASKIGKSWLMLWLGLQVAQGNSIWGLPTLQCDVLYLSLEDTQRRIKDRLYNLTDSAPDNLYFAVTSGLIGGGLEEQITDFLTEHPATKLVIIDTLQKVRDSKGSAGKAGMYGNDYDDISSIKRIADGFNIAILLVHHLRKLQDSDDPFNDVSGSTGIIGAADTNFILRRKRSGNAATLLVSGRDVEYQELTLRFNDLVWELVERKNSEDIHKAELPKFLFRVVDFMECRTEWHPLPMFEAIPENCEAFRRWLDSQWAELPEALPTQTASELVGHSPQRIHEWIREEVLVGIKLGTIQYCAKAEFIGFMASPQRLAHPRTEKYKELIREFKYNRRRERENEQRRQKRKMMKEST